MAHIGIISLMIGSLITQKQGTDGMMRLEEGQVGSTLELDENFLYIVDGQKVESIFVPWIAPGVKFSPLSVPNYRVEIRDYITHAEGAVNFLPIVDTALEKTAPQDLRPAVQIEVKGGPMRITQAQWLWSGEMGWKTVTLGPAQFSVLTETPAPVVKSGKKKVAEAEEPKSRLPEGHPPIEGAAMGAGNKKSAHFEVIAVPGAPLRFRATSSVGDVTEGQVKLGEVIHPIGWRGGVELKVLQFLPNARSEVSYFPSKSQYGSQLPSSAIKILAGGSEMWLGLGDRARLDVEGREVGIVYTPRRIQLPFSLSLEKFILERYQGTMDPSKYASDVSVHPSGGAPKFAYHISMNEPLEHGGFTFYQSSYEPGEPRPTVSIFSVNRDPGRFLKYFGSILLVLGSIYLFSMKVSARKKMATPNGA